jgi:hypothetical protein
MVEGYDGAELLTSWQPGSKKEYMSAFLTSSLMLLLV